MKRASDDDQTNADGLTAKERRAMKRAALQPEGTVATPAAKATPTAVSTPGDQTNADGLTAKERRAMKRAALQPEGAVATPAAKATPVAVSTTGDQTNADGLTAKERRAMKRAALQPEGAVATPAAKATPVAVSTTGDQNNADGLTAKERRAMKRAALQTEQSLTSAVNSVSSMTSSFNTESKPSLSSSSTAGRGGGKGRGGGMYDGDGGRGSYGGRGKGKGGRTGPRFQGFDNRPPLARPVPTGPLSSVLPKDELRCKSDSVKVVVVSGSNNTNPLNNKKSATGSGGGGGKGSKYVKRPKNNKELRPLLEKHDSMDGLLTCFEEHESKMGDDDVCHAFHLVAQLEKKLSSPKPIWTEHGIKWGALIGRLTAVVPFLAVRSLTKAIHALGTLAVPPTTSCIPAMCERLSTVAQEAINHIDKKSSSKNSYGRGGGGPAKITPFGSSANMGPAADVVPLIDGGLDTMAIGSCIWGLGKVMNMSSKLVETEANTGADDKLLNGPMKDMLQQIDQCSLKMISLFNSQDIGNTMWGMARLRYLCSNELGKAFLTRAKFLNKMHGTSGKFKPQEIADILWSVGILVSKQQKDKEPFFLLERDYDIGKEWGFEMIMSVAVELQNRLNAKRDSVSLGHKSRGIFAFSHSTILMMTAVSPAGKSATLKTSFTNKQRNSMIAAFMHLSHETCTSLNEVIAASTATTSSGNSGSVFAELPMLLSSCSRFLSSLLGEMKAVLFKTKEDNELNSGTSSFFDSILTLTSNILQVGRIRLHELSPLTIVKTIQTAAAAITLQDEITKSLNFEVLPSNNSNSTSENSSNRQLVLDKVSALYKTACEIMTKVSVEVSLRASSIVADGSAFSQLLSSFAHLPDFTLITGDVYDLKRNIERATNRLIKELEKLVGGAGGSTSMNQLDNSYSARDVATLIWSLGRIHSSMSKDSNTSLEDVEESSSSDYHLKHKAGGVSLSASLMHMLQLRLAKCINTSSTATEGSNSASTSNSISAQSIANCLWGVVALGSFLESDLADAIIQGTEYKKRHSSDKFATTSSQTSCVYLCGKLRLTQFKAREAASMLWSLARLDHPKFKTTTVDSTNDDNNDDINQSNSGDDDQVDDDEFLSKKGSYLFTALSSHALSLLVEMQLENTSTPKLILSDCVDCLWALAKQRPPEVVDDKENVEIRIKFAQIAGRSLVDLTSQNDVVSLGSTQYKDIITSAQLATLSWSLVKLKVLHVFNSCSASALSSGLASSSSKNDAEIVSSKKKKKAKLSKSQSESQSQESKQAGNMLLSLIQQYLKDKCFNSMQCGLLAWAVALWPCFVQQQFHVFNSFQQTPMSLPTTSTTTTGFDSNLLLSLKETDALRSLGLSLLQEMTSLSQSSSKTSSGINARTVANFDFLERNLKSSKDLNNAATILSNSTALWLQEAAQQSVNEIQAYAKNNDQAAMRALMVALEINPQTQRSLSFPLLLLGGNKATLQSLNQTLSASIKEKSEENAPTTADLVHLYSRNCSDGGAVKGEVWPKATEQQSPHYLSALLRLPSTGDFTAIEFAIASAASSLKYGNENEEKEEKSVGLLWIYGTMSEGLVSQKTYDILEKWEFGNFKLIFTTPEGGGVLSTRKVSVSSHETNLKLSPSFSVDPIAYWKSQCDLTFPVEVLYGREDSEENNGQSNAVLLAENGSNISRHVEVVKEWTSYPGLFAAGKLDVMTAFLLTHLPSSLTLPTCSTTTIPPHAASNKSLRVLDFACGSGVIAYSVACRHYKAWQSASNIASSSSSAIKMMDIDALDCDSVAVRAAEQNLASFHSNHKKSQKCLNSRVLLSDSLDNVMTADLSSKYDVIISNPPLHNGKLSDYSVVMDLIQGHALNGGGCLWLVTQVGVPLGPLFDKVSGNAKNSVYDRVELISDGRFALWCAVKKATNSSITTSISSFNSNSTTDSPSPMSMNAKRKQSDEEIDLKEEKQKKKRKKEMKKSSKVKLENSEKNTGDEEGTKKKKKKKEKQ